MVDGYRKSVLRWLFLLSCMHRWHPMASIISLIKFYLCFSLSITMIKLSVPDCTFPALYPVIVLSGYFLMIDFPFRPNGSPGMTFFVMPFGLLPSLFLFCNGYKLLTNKTKVKWRFQKQNQQQKQQLTRN